MKRKYLLLCLVAFALCGCPRKETCSQNELVEAPPEFLQYWYFPKGSYWVYQLKDTVGVYDTVTVVNDYKRYCDGTDPNNPDCDQPDCVWMYSNTWQHSNYQYFGSNPQYHPQNFNTSYYMGAYWIVVSSPGINKVDTPNAPFKYPFVVGETYNSDNTIISESSITNSAGTFENTLCIQTDKNTLIDSTLVDYVKYIYITPKTGIIRWHYTHNKVWELVSYDVTP